MKCVSILLLFFVGLNSVSAPEDELVDNVATWLKTANSKEIAENFSSTVQLTIFEEEDTYSKVQAELVLKSFFLKHKPSAVKIIHKLSSNPNYRFAVVHLTTDKGKFRVSYSLKKSGARFFITEMRFENSEE